MHRTCSCNLGFLSNFMIRINTLPNEININNMSIQRIAS
ncbi:hypothetical protein CoNPh11_CDS0218 [Staphylococcus phage S-CoN_Ph11]|nr:hypothetical protein CoNPh11_CDS0218 [Staphylococcus phage S-CoN_Ph11]